MTDLVIQYETGSIHEWRCGNKLSFHRMNYPIEQLKNKKCGRLVEECLILKAALKMTGVSSRVNPRFSGCV